MKKKTRRLTVRGQEQVYGCEYFTPEDMIKKRDALLTRLAAEGIDVVNTKVFFEVQEYGHAYDPNSYHGVFMVWDSPETDEQMRVRGEDEDEQKAKVLALKRLQYEALKKELGEP